MRQAKKHPPEEPVPEDGRYDGRPFVMFLDAYVQSAIGELPASRAARLQDMVPNLQSTFDSSKPDWTSIVAEQMEFPAELPESLRAMWQRNVAAFEEAEGEADPVLFARLVVDRNFIPDL